MLHLPPPYIFVTYFINYKQKYDTYDFRLGRHREEKTCVIFNWDKPKISKIISVMSFHPYFWFFEIWTESHVTVTWCDGTRGLLGPQTNEGLKVEEVNVIWMNTWGFLNQTNNITRSWVFFFSLYISFIHFFSFKRKHNCDNRQTKSKTNTTKKKYSNVEDELLPTVSD